MSSLSSHGTEKNNRRRIEWKVLGQVRRPPLKTNTHLEDRETLRNLRIFPVLPGQMKLFLVQSCECFSSRFVQQEAEAVVGWNSLLWVCCGVRGKNFDAAVCTADQHGVRMGQEAVSKFSSTYRTF